MGKCSFLRLRDSAVWYGTDAVIQLRCELQSRSVEFSMYIPESESLIERLLWSVDMCTRTQGETEVLTQ